MSVKTKGQTKVWRSLVKYGPEKHLYEIIDQCDSSDLNKLERYYQELYDSVDNGLNCVYTKTNDKSGKVSKDTLKRMSLSQKGNNNWLGRKHTDATKEIIRLKATGRKFSDEVNKRKGRKGRVSNRKGVKYSGKNVVQYDLNGKVIKEWVSVSKVCEELGYSAGNISSCCNGRLKTYKKCKWSYI